MSEITTHPASYRDPAGFVFTTGGVHYRQVNQSYSAQYDTLMRSGLYDHLTKEALLIPHTEVPDIVHAEAPNTRPIKVPNVSQTPAPYKTLLPRQLSRLSYAAEWCPEQLRDAALLTLTIQQLAMDHGMTLKDATPFNIQFDNGKPLFIDTLSFDKYDPAKPWIAYRQFCESFLFPLYIHRYAQIGTHKISAAWPDGIPASATARLLPFSSRLNAGAWLHVFLQNQVGSRKRATAEQHIQFSKAKLTSITEHLQSLINRSTPRPQRPSAWSNYYSKTIPGKTYLEKKQQLFRQYLQAIEFSDALDLGCNDGLFSKILAETGAPVIAVDSDWPSISNLYRSNTPGIHPLCIDLANPTPASGFANAERAAFTERAASDLVIALALVHHLALGNNIPLNLIAGYFSQLTKRRLIIEFIPLSDEKAGELIARKEVPAPTYDNRQFEMAFGESFRIDKRDPITGTDRLLYLMTKR
ncbi:MAG TPA: hypothetical protein VFE32_11900 [Puia sp.]|jgi:SAM-dependent methyltransferase|nr:hypothetical protein [Puia sp.]